MKNPRTTGAGIAILITVVASIIKAVATYGWGELASLDWGLIVPQILAGLAAISGPDAKKVEQRIDRVEAEMDTKVDGPEQPKTP